MHCGRITVARIAARRPDFYNIMALSLWPAAHPRRAISIQPRADYARDLSGEARASVTGFVIRMTDSEKIDSRFSLLFEALPSSGTRVIWSPRRNKTQSCAAKFTQLRDPMIITLHILPFRALHPSGAISVTIAHLYSRPPRVSIQNFI